MKIKVSELIANFFADNGIDTVFTVTGGGAMHMNDSFGHHSKLNCIYNHHEQGCSLAAEGYARVAAKPAAVCVTSGPGGTNAITGVMGAWLDSIPMFVVSGQVKFVTTTASVPHLKLRQLGDQEFNIIGSVSNMTKYAYMVTNANEILYHLEKAWYLMLDNRPAPVWLDIPLDVQGAMVDTDELVRFNPSEVGGATLDKFDSSDVAKVLSLIKSAKKPVILAGIGIRNSNYVDRFMEFANRLNIPVLTPTANLDVIAENDRLYCGRPGSIGLRGGNFVMQSADLVLSLGCQLSIRQVSYNWENFAPEAKIIAVDYDRDELRKPTISVDYPYCLDLRSFIDICLNESSFNSNSHAKWLDWSKAIHNRFPATDMISAVREGYVNPYLVVDRMSDLMSDDEVVVCSNGTAFVATAQAHKIKRGQRVFMNSGCASMGYGLPAAIGAAMANDNNRVICLEGDGSIMMNIQELMTASYNRLNIKLIIFNNNGYHSIRQTQTNLFGHHPMCGVTPADGVAFPEFSKVANAFDFRYRLVNSMEGFDDIFSDFISHDGCEMLEIMTDEQQYFQPKLSAKVLDDGRIVSPPLQDMYPFLDREKYESIKFEE